MAATERDRTKVVIRNLPPLIQESDVRLLVDQGFKEKITWFYFVPGKMSTKRGAIRSQAYVNLSTPADVVLFKAAIHGHAFVTQRGVKHECQVEYAPNQKVPKPTTKQDPREGTVEQDADFLKFVEQLEKEMAPVEPKSILDHEATVAPAPKAAARVTALMREIQARRAGIKGSIKPGLRAYDVVSDPVGLPNPIHAADSGVKAEVIDRKEHRDKRSKAPSKDKSSAATAALEDLTQAEVSSIQGSKAEPKAVRMRAGFGVFAPTRVGRLLEEANTANAVSASAKEASSSLLPLKETSRPPSRGSSVGAEPPHPVQAIGKQPPLDTQAAVQAALLRPSSKSGRSAKAASQQANSTASPAKLANEQASSANNANQQPNSRRRSKAAHREQGEAGKGADGRKGGGTSQPDIAASFGQQPLGRTVSASSDAQQPAILKRPQPHRKVGEWE